MDTCWLNVVLDVYKKGLPNDSPSPMVEVSKDWVRNSQPSVQVCPEAVP